MASLSPSPSSHLLAGLTVTFKSSAVLCVCVCASRTALTWSFPRARLWRCCLVPSLWRHSAYSFLFLLLVISELCEIRLPKKLNMCIISKRNNASSKTQAVPQPRQTPSEIVATIASLQTADPIPTILELREMCRLLFIPVPLMFNSSSSSSNSNTHRKLNWIQVIAMANKEPLATASMAF